mmetsp:Transcript_9619/g.31410  ORF Transcript_9619/g.31410 Transcript_9619/m.31410 type:complete len:214 (-) Transcript_9619:7-648(-)
MALRLAGDQHRRISGHVARAELIKHVPAWHTLQKRLRHVRRENNGARAFVAGLRFVGDVQQAVGDAKAGLRVAPRLALDEVSKLVDLLDAIVRRRGNEEALRIGVVGHARWRVAPKWRVARLGRLEGAIPIVGEGGHVSNVRVHSGHADAHNLVAASGENLDSVSHSDGVASLRRARRERIAPRRGVPRRAKQVRMHGRIFLRRLHARWQRRD